MLKPWDGFWHNEKCKLMNKVCKWRRNYNQIGCRPPLSFVQLDYFKWEAMKASTRTRTDASWWIYEQKDEVTAELQPTNSQSPLKKHKNKIAVNFPVRNEEGWSRWHTSNLAFREKLPTKTLWRTLFLKRGSKRRISTKRDKHWKNKTPLVWKEWMSERHSERQHIHTACMH